MAPDASSPSRSAFGRAFARLASAALLALALLPAAAEQQDARASAAAQWLCARVDGLVGGDDTSERGRAELALAVRALAGQHAASKSTIARAIAALRTAQRTDGSISSSPALTWLALGAFASVDDDSARSGAERARTYLAGSASAAPHQPREGSESESVRRARDFLAAARASTSQAALDLDLESAFTLAGGPFDARRAYADALAAESPTVSIAADAAAHAWFGEPLYELALAAAVLDRYRTSKEATLLAETMRPMAWFARELELHWNAAAGAWSDRRGGEPTLVATASALIAAEILARWNSAAERVESAPVVAPPRSADELRAGCESCHAGLHPALVAQWRDSRHRRERVDCVSCHGDNHSTIFREAGRVSVDACGECHARSVAEFALSRHALAEATLLQSPLFAATARADRATCMGCHRIGERGTGLAPGNCNYCHPGHAFSAAQAREPEACTVCHTGEDYPQDLAYRLSKHGALYAQTRDDAVAPTCATCHQPGGRHDDGFGLTLGSSGSGAVLAGEPVPFPMRTLSASEFAAQRAAMVGVCAQCHSSRLVEQSLRQADEIKREGDALLREAALLLEALHAEGLLGQEPSTPLRLGPEQLRPDPSAPGSAALERFYEMWRFHFAASWKGAYHQSHSIANQRSRPGLGEDLQFLRAEAERLRSKGVRR